MNTATKWAVGCLVVWTSCVEINGGAAELNWTLRTFDGENIGNDVEQCIRPGVSKIRLTWNNTDTNQVGFGEWNCQQLHGDTAFEIDPGRVTLTVSPVCADGQPANAGTFNPPPPQVRTVTLGQVVSLRTVLLEVHDSTGPGKTCETTLAN